jgi:hypothetical protein
VDGAERFLAGPSTVGPWAPNLQHGGPPNALAVTVAEKAVHEATGRTDLRSQRFAADFVGAVPVGEVGVRTRVLRVARSAALVEATVSGAGRDCLVARVWFVRDLDTSTVAAPAVAPPERPPAIVGPLPEDWRFGWGESMDWRYVEGRMGGLGPAATWVRPRLPLCEGLELSGLGRCALVADSASGVSSELDWAQWSFVNVDLDIHLARPFEGEWVLMDAATQLGPNGSALARSTLSDRRGVVGSGLQTLVLAPR